MNHLKFLIGFFALIAFESRGSEIENPQLTPGNTTTLSIEHFGVLRYEGTMGETTIQLIDSQSRKKIFKKQEKGVFVCLGFNSTTGEFIVGKAITDGAALPIGAFYYLSEKTKLWRNSQYSRKDLLVFSSECSPTGSFIALVGNEKSTDGPDKLFVYDTKNDKYRIVGDAPLPPPLDKTSCDEWKERDMEDAWGWSFIFVDGYIKLEPGIITFPDAETLQVSYGEDTCRKRSHKRTVKQWKLNNLF